MASKVWFSLVKTVWKMQQVYQNKQRRKLRRGSYDCTDNRVNAVVFLNDTAIVTCASNYAGAALESFIKRWLKADKKKTNVSMAHALKLYDKKVGRLDLFDQFVATILSKSGGHFLLGASKML